jgi:hypothetical protein
MTATSALQITPRFQFETNSGSLNASQVVNCGPTSICAVADFYRDQFYGIEATRRAVMACCIGTSCYQQQQMLAYHGVPASTLVPTSIAQMRTLVAGGTRPFAIRVLMSRVPASVRDHSFLGWHMMAVLAPASVSGLTGFWVNDPNFSPLGGYRPDPDKGHKFYSDAVMKYAFIDNGPAFAVVPNKSKVVPVAKITVLASYSPTKTALIAPNATIYGYDPKRPGKAVATFKATSLGSSFPVDKTVHIDWPDPTTYNPVPHGTFVHGTAGVFAGLYVQASTVTLR